MIRTLGIVLFLAGLGSVMLAVLLGEMSFGLVLFIIPVVYGSSAFGILGALLIVAGIFAYFWGGVDEARKADSSSEPSEEKSSAKREIGGVVLIGPIPIVFGTSSRAALYAMIAAAVLIVLLMLAFLALR